MTREEEVREAFKDAAVWKIRIGRKLHLVMGYKHEIEEAKERMIKEARKAMLRGADCEWDGLVRWIEFWEVQPVEWHDDGNRSKHVRKMVLKDADGNITRMEEAVCWRNPDLI